MTYLPPDPAVDATVTPDASHKLNFDRIMSRPRPPVTRWNRRYLLALTIGLAAIIGGAFWAGFGGSQQHLAKARSNQSPVEATPAEPIILGRYAKGYGDPAVQAMQAPGTASLPPPDSGTVATQPAGKPTDPAVQAAQEQATAARTAGPFFPIGSGQTAQSSSGSISPLTAAPVSTMAGATPSSDVGSANGQGAKRQFLSDAKAQDYVTNPLRQPESPWEVKAGSIISAALLTAINSDLPGEVIAQVTEPVYDHATGRTVLIPQGSRLIGIYDSQISYGQERALVAWTRIIMPNGTSMNLGSMSGGDLSGAAGMKDQVDARFWQMARGVLLSTVFSVGAASAQDASARSSGELVINSAGSGISNGAQQIGLQLTQRDLNRQPIIKIRPGWPLSVLVSKDMVLSPYP